MVKEFGYAGRILRVDLSQGSMLTVSTKDYADRFVGGRGVAAKIYWDEVPPNVRAFDAENTLIFITGPLAGFPGLAGSRWQICGKSPAVIPEFFSYANLGGSWGAQLKFAGYDGIIVQGKSDKPVYLFIQDRKAEIRDASSLWGKSAVEVRETLKRELGSSVRVVATGPAGDNLATMAIVLADDDATGSGGFGAVMGSKKLKAIAVAASERKVTASNPENLPQLRNHIRHLKEESRFNYAGNGRRATQEPLLKSPKMKQTACYGCISGCARYTYTAENGKKAKFMCVGGAFYIPFAKRYYGKTGDIPFHAYRICNEYGVDTNSMWPIIRWLDRCYGAGILTDENTGMPLSKIGSVEFIETLIEKISLRQGFGNVLAQGIFKAADSIGEKAKQQIGNTCFDAYYRTGQMYLYEPRLYLITGLLYATEPSRQPIQELHEVHWPISLWVEWCNKMEGAYVSSEVIRSISKKFFGSEIGMDFSTYEGKALAAKMIQDREYAKECLILCDFSWPMMDVKHSEDHVGDPTLPSKVLSAVTGKEMDEQGLDEVGERVFNLQRAIVMREGYEGRESENLPETDYTMPLTVPTTGANSKAILPGKGGEIIFREGTVIDKEQFEKMKDEYYQLRGWDIARGFQTEAKLRQLGLQDIIEDLKARGLVS